MPRAQTATLYWLYDDRCVCIWRHGYIGMTVDWPHRMHRHRSESKFLPHDFKGQVLFQGTIRQCTNWEKTLRPIAGIGWNKLPGGLSGHASKGVPKSPEHREKMRQAALARYTKPGEKERTAKAVKKAFRKIDRSGENNAMFGHHHSEESKQKLRDRVKERGGVSGKLNPNYRHGRYT
jgi:hypothetical protein